MKLNPRLNLIITIDSAIRGYHAYKDVWVSYIGVLLQCLHDERMHPLQSFDLLGQAAKQK